MLAQGALSPSTNPVLAVAPLIALAVALVGYCLVDIARSPTVRALPKPAWVLIVVLVSVPLGALIYLIWGRNRDDVTNPGFTAAELAELARDGERRAAGR